MPRFTGIPLSRRTPADDEGEAIDLARPKLSNSDGSFSTERSITVEVDELNEGKPTNIPTIWGGQQLSDDDAIGRAVASQQQFPAFNSIDEAVLSAKSRSEKIGELRSEPAAEKPKPRFAGRPLQSATPSAPKVEEEIDGPGAIARGFYTGMRQQNPEMLGEALEGASQFADEGGDMRRIAQGASKSLKDFAQSGEDPNYAPKVPSLKDIDGVGSAFTYAGEKMGQGIASMVPPVASGVTASMVAKRVGGGKGAQRIAGIAGATVPSATMNYGELYQALKAEGVPEERASEVAAIGAGPITALDVAGMGGTISNLTREAKSSVIQSVAKRLAVETLKGARDEGLTEMAQEATKIAIVGLETGKDVLTADKGVQMLDAFAGGALGGGPVRGATSLTQRPGQPQGDELDQYVEELDQELAPKENSAAPAAPTQPLPETQELFDEGGKVIGRVNTATGEFILDSGTNPQNAPASLQGESATSDQATAGGLVPPPQPAPQRRNSESVLQWLTGYSSQPGKRGMVDSGGEMRARDALNYFVPGRGKPFTLNAERGNDPDKVREGAIEAGYLPEGATVNDLYRLIDGELRGGTGARPEDIAAAGPQDPGKARHDMEFVAQSYGIDPTPFDDVSLEAEIDRRRAHEIDADDFEKALTADGALDRYFDLGQFENFEADNAERQNTQSDPPFAESGNEGGERYPTLPTNAGSGDAPNAQLGRGDERAPQGDVSQVPEGEADNLASFPGALTAQHQRVDGQSVDVQFPDQLHADLYAFGRDLRTGVAKPGIITNRVRDLYSRLKPWVIEDFDNARSVASLAADYHDVADNTGGELPVIVDPDLQQDYLASSGRQQRRAVPASFEPDETFDVDDARLNPDRIAPDDGSQPEEPLERERMYARVGADASRQAREELGAGIFSTSDPVQKRALEIIDERIAKERGDGTRSAPIKVETGEDLDAARPNVAEPTDAQKEAGNYKKAHVRYQGFDITIETAKGQERSGTSPDGERWAVTMPADYGYIKRTEGNDGDQVDVYLGPQPDSDMVFVVDQVDPKTGKFDEHKVFMGYVSPLNVMRAYDAAFSDASGPDRRAAITPISVADFKERLAEGKFTKPVNREAVRGLAEGAQAKLARKRTAGKVEQLQKFLQQTATTRRDRTTNKAQWIDLGETSPATAEKINQLIKQKTGRAVDVTGMHHIVDTDAVNKILNDHGSAKTEAPRGQLPITEEDISLIPQIIDEGEIVDASQTPQGLDAVVYRAEIGDTLYYVEEVRRKRGALAAKTMWKRPRRSLSGSNATGVVEQKSGYLRGDGNVPADNAAGKAEQPTEKTTISPEHQKAFNKLRAELDRLGLKDVGLKIAEKVQSIIDGKVIEGDAKYLNELIEVAQDVAAGKTAISRLGHEVVHAIRDLDLLSGKEWNILAAQARRTWLEEFGIPNRYNDLDADAQLEEAVAEAFGRFLQVSVPRANTREGGVLGRLKRILQAVGGWAKGDGYEATRLMQKIASGEVGARSQAKKQPRFKGNKIANPEKLARRKDPTLLGSDWSAVTPGVFDVLAEANGPPIERLRRAMAWPQIQASLDAARRKLQDYFIPVRRAQEAIENVTGKKLSENENTYLKEEMFSGRTGDKLFKLQKDHIEPLLKQIRASGLKLDQVEEYLYARHAKERNAQIGRINEKFQDGSGSGMTDAEADGILAEIEQSGKLREYKAIGAAVDRVIAGAIDERVSQGLLSNEDAQRWRSTYRHYVPLKGMPEHEGMDVEPARPATGSGFNVRGKESKRAFGRESRATDILANIVMSAQEAIIRGEKNRVGKALFNLVENNPNPNAWTVNKTESRPVLNSQSGLVEYRPSAHLSPEEEAKTVRLKVDGREIRVTFEDPRMAEALRDVRPDRASWLIRTLGKITGTLSFMITRGNPAFVPINAFRDLIAGMTVMQKFGIPGLQYAVMKDWRKALAAGWKGQWSTKADTDMSKWYREFAETGGRVSFFKSDDINDTRDALQREIAALKPGISYAKARSAAGKLVEVIEAANDAVDNAMRLALYKNLRERGWTKERAASAAKNLTVNFNRRGQWGRTLNALFMFYNAGIQGTAVLANAMKSPAVRRIAYGMAALGFTTEMLNAILSPDGDDGEPEYDKISEGDKRRNLIIMWPNAKGEHTKIPLPYGFNVFFDVGRNVGALMRGKQDLGGTAANLFFSFLESFNPLGGTDSIANMVAPTVLDPVIDLGMNRDRFGKPIYPERANEQWKPDSQKAYSNVSGVAQWLAEGLNKLGGGDELVGSQLPFMDVSPEGIEYVWDWTTGGLGRFIRQSVDLPNKWLAGEDVSARDWPIVRTFFGAAPSRFADRESFYTRTREADEAEQLLKQAKDTATPERLAELKKEYGPIADLRRKGDRTARDLSDVRKKIRIAREKGDKPQLERQRELERDKIVGFNKDYVAAKQKMEPERAKLFRDFVRNPAREAFR